MKTSFVILSQSRSGSTLLRYLIDSHPEINCEGEIFATVEKYLDSQFFCDLWRSLPYPYLYYRRTLSFDKHYGYTLFIYHLKRLKKTIPMLNNLGWKIIYLRRKNIVDQSFSNLLAMKTKQWHRRDEEKVLENKQTLSVDKFVQEVKTRKMWYEKQTDILESVPHLTINYEDDLEKEQNWQPSLNRVFQYLEIETCHVSSNLKKLYSKPYAELIENYDEAMEALKKNDLGYLLDKNT